ncbi:MAG: DUF4139 domain-containing protein [Planctomycetes bacterium]|nr:DUF4139 domain-containing protein [Planctomycetota bacterium]
MRRKWQLLALTVAVVLGGTVLWQMGLVSGQNLDKGNGAKAVDPLPIRQVVLFNSGVGYFQREGDVLGNARVDLTFPSAEINDLLKSLVLQDLGGGKISTVNYDSHDPIDRILHSFALDLNNNPTFSQILNQARGEKIDVFRVEKKDAQPAKITGTIVGMETHQKATDKGAVVNVEILNLSGPNGLQALPLDEVVGVKFLNPTLDSEFQRALKVLAGTHDSMKKTVSLGFNGNGNRAVRVGYVVERPIWKTSYRLRLDQGGKLSIQGWALVDNTSDDDWNDVRMVLVSGKPISYQMNLYEPLYIPRPFVEPELFASLRPPVYSGAMEMDRAEKADKKALEAPQGSGGKALQDAMQRREQNLAAQSPASNLPNIQSKLTYEELQERRRQQQEKGKDAKKVGGFIAGLNFKEGIQSVASAEDIGDYFQYVLDQKITLPRQKSAMLPILDQTIDGAKVSIYNESIQAKFPLLGLRLKNTSGQSLTQGPITVYDGGTYAGDTRILDLQPGEERLLSYALDQTTEIKTDVKETPSPDLNFKIDQAQLAARYKLQQTKTYTIKNRSTHDRTVILEHPIRESWNLLSPAKPAEKSRNVYRFTVPVPAGQTVKQDVVEEQARLDQVALGGAPFPLYAIGLGITVKPVINVDEPKLTGLRINKGVVVASHKIRESKTYFVQNLSEQDRNFTVDHIVRPDWTRLAQEGDNQRGPAVHRFVLKVAKGKTGDQQVIEEHIQTDKGKVLKEFSEAKLREWLANPVPSSDVKAALNKALGLAGKVQESRKKLDGLEKQLEASSKDQARLRENLKIIPQSSEHYKKFLEKFVSQESQIENLQRDIREVSAALNAAEQEYLEFITKASAE